MDMVDYIPIMYPVLYIIIYLYISHSRWFSSKFPCFHHGTIWKIWLLNVPLEQSEVDIWLLNPVLEGSSYLQDGAP